MIPNDWRPRRQRLIHMTIRDVDCADFDVADMVATFRRCHVSAFSFFAGGYVTTYPSSLPWQRIVPQLEGRDLCGEIIRAAHEAGMVAFPMIDLGELPVDVAEAHPDWPARREDGSWFVKSDGIVTSCPLGGYVRECVKELLDELLGRYDIDGIKFGGASYGFAPGVCHCEHCAAAYRGEAGSDLPTGPDAMKDRAYLAWRQRKMEETVAYLIDTVHERADIPVVGNSVWHLGRGMPIDELARRQDFVQIEVQFRTHFGDDAAPSSWERFTFPTESCRYVSRLTKRPPWVVASYFLAWPWRRVAVPWPEQKLYLAQIAANGGSPMVNLSGGPPKVHEDKRGFRAIEELYGFMARHAELYDGDESAANVALLYCPASAQRARDEGDLDGGYLRELHAFEDVLNRGQIPYDIVSAEHLDDSAADRYDVLVLPHAPALQTEAAGLIGALAKRGLGVVTGGTPEPLADLLGVESCDGPRPSLASPHAGPCQAYARLADPDHPLLEGIEAALMALAGPWWKVRPREDAHVPLVRAPAFRVFPEGRSYPDEPDPGEPLAFVRQPEGAGRQVAFPFLIGRCAERTGHPDPRRIITNAVRWATRSPVPVALRGGPDVLLSLRSVPGRRLVHLINTTGRHRYLTDFAPLHDLKLTIHCADRPARVRLASSESELPWRWERGRVVITIPTLVDYDIVVVETEASSA